MPPPIIANGGGGRRFLGSIDMFVFLQAPPSTCLVQEFPTGSWLGFLSFSICSWLRPGKLIARCLGLSALLVIVLVCSRCTVLYLLCLVDCRYWGCFYRTQFPVGCLLSLSFLLPLPSPPWVVCPCSAPLVLPSVVPFVKIDCLGCILFSLISSCVLVGQFLGLSHGFIPRSGGFGGACLALD